MPLSGPNAHTAILNNCIGPLIDSLRAFVCRAYDDGQLEHTTG